MEIAKLLVFIILLLVNVSSVYSQENVQVSKGTRAVAINEEKPLSEMKIAFYDNDNITNQIPYFDNRFRIDAELEEITLIFFRVRGSTPIILVQPDGKKQRISDYDQEKIQWHDDSTFDMIKITKPMVGPWQAIGDILPESKIFVVSRIPIR